MPGLTVTVLLQDIKKLETEALIVGFYEDVRPLKGLAGELDWLLCGSLSNLILEKKLRGSLGDVALLTSQGKVPAQKIFMIGLGPRARFSLAAQRSAVGTAASTAIDAGVRNAAIECFLSADISYDDLVSTFRDGMAERVGGRSLHLDLLAPDASSYEKITRLATTEPYQKQQ